MRIGSDWRRFGATTYEQFVEEHEQRIRSFTALVRICRAVVSCAQCALFVGAMIVSAAATIKIIDAALDKIHY